MHGEQPAKLATSMLCEFKGFGFLLPKLVNILFKKTLQSITKT